MNDQAALAPAASGDVSTSAVAPSEQRPPELVPTYSPSRELGLSGRSALARELSQLQTTARRALRLNDGVLQILDLAIVIARVMIDEDDTRPLSQRFEDLEKYYPDWSNEEELDEHTGEILLASLDALVQGDGAPLLRMQSGNFQDFVKRLVGAAHWERLVQAAKDDGAIAFVASRRALRYVMPLAIALDDCAAVLSPNQLAQVPGLSAMGESLLTLSLQIDGLFDQLLNRHAIPLQSLPSRPREAEPLARDIGAITQELRQVLEGMARASVADLSDRLTKKLEGAQHALQFSPDPISQAAGSQVEFIDRLLRDSFDDEAVLAWVQRQSAQRHAELRYWTGETWRPTKLAEALCFVSAGRDLDEASTFQELPARGLVKARREMEQLKHADQGTEEELTQLRRCMAATEGFFVFAVRVGWALVDDELVEALRSRL